MHFGRLLNAAGESLNLKLLDAAGRLHDLAKGQPEHALCGARILRKTGFPEVADIVAVHMDIDLTANNHTINEAQLIYLENKMKTLPNGSISAIDNL
jgi:HD superfamily phosphodiesterase